LPAKRCNRQYITLVEYTGSYPQTDAPHGNAKHITHDYIRTNPETFEKIQDGIANKRSNIDIYKEMVLESPENAPRDDQQIRSKRYRDKKKTMSGTSNIADQVLEGLSMVNNHEFVQEAVYTNGNNKPPSFICYTKTQFEDMKLHLQRDSNCTIGVDRTFNLGPAYRTNFVYKNKKVILKSSRENPIFAGPVLFHWDTSFLTYHSFFSHVKVRLKTDVNCIDIRIGGMMRVV
jgi:hypothetical protein